MTMMPIPQAASSAKTLVILFGPPAVGKMAVGVELSRLTGLPLFHNHVIIEPVLRFFPFGSDAYNRIVPAFRQTIFEEVARSDLPGLVFTYVWALNEPEDKAYVDGIVSLFGDARVCFVELAATLAERQRRNETPLRLAEKPSKRNVELSRQTLAAADRDYRMNSDGDFFYPDRHVKIETTNLSPEETARLIVERFALK